MTREGSTLGTLPYMSPEQLQGKSVDLRSDLFSFGILLYEMVTGEHPFRRDTAIDTASAVLTARPAPLSEHLEHAPAGLQELIDGLLQVDREARLQSADEALATLRTISAGVFHGAGASAGRPHRRAVAIVTAVIVLLVVGAALWLPYRSRRQVGAAREQLTKIERLVADGAYVQAYELALRAEEYLSEDPSLQRWMPEISDRLTITTDPEGASVYLQPLASDGGGSSERQRVGATPLKGLRIARTDYRLWLEMEGRVTQERVISSTLNRAEVRFDGVEPDIVLDLTLPALGAVPSDMVAVAGGGVQLRFGFAGSAALTIDDFFIDRYEVSNRQYLEFIRAGGYDEPSYWQHAIVADGVEVSPDQATELFRDRSGLVGPREWTNQEFPKGKGDHPVTGVSWYEAAAYAEYAGKTLPTIYQWMKAARGEMLSHFEGIVMPWGLMLLDAFSAQRANLYGRDTTAVDSYPFGISPYGAYNMAGNVAEWCLNESSEGRPAIAGGSWADAVHQFGARDSRPTLERANTVGFRCVSKPAPGSTDQGTARLEPPRRRQSITPVDDATYGAFLSHYRYDKKDLAAEVLETLETPDWRREKLTFSGVGGDRVIAYLYLPKRAKAPYQVINYVVSSTVFFGRTAAEEVEALLASQIKTGRAVFAAVPKGALEREWPGHSDWPARAGSVEARDELLLRVTEFRMGLDYLETRGEIDTGRIAHVGFSWGALDRALVLNAVESRIRSVIFIGGGLLSLPRLPETRSDHFVPRIQGPTLVLLGSHDEIIDKSYGRALYELLPEPKRLEVVESGHLPTVELRNPIINEFLDETLGRVDR